MASIDSTTALTKHLVSQLGIEITRLARPASPPAGLASFLLSRKVSLVFDVGADTGQYGREVRALGYRGRIVSFEPASVAHATLKKGVARDPRWIVAPRTAIGSEEGVITINPPANSAAMRVPAGSRPLPSLEVNSVLSREEQVPLATLNSLAPAHIKRGDVVYLKIDVEGFEYEVLHGADNILNALCGVQLKLSPVPPSQGGKPFRFMLDFMASQGFEIHSLSSASAGNAAGRAIQFDAIFTRGRASDAR